MNCPAMPVWSKYSCGARVVFQQSEPERVCGALGAFREGGMPLEAHPLWRRLAPTSTYGIRGALQVRFIMPIWLCR